MKRSDIRPMPGYFDKYINCINDIPLAEALKTSVADIKALDLAKLGNIGDRKYAADKWTVKEIFQHLVDVERIFCYRALLIARNDYSETASFDESFIAANSKANEKALHSIVEDLLVQRQSTISLFNSFDDEVLMRKGKNWKYEMNVLAFGFCIAGHQAWHFKTIQEKYLVNTID